MLVCLYRQDFQLLLLGETACNSHRERTSRDAACCHEGPVALKMDLFTSVTIGRLSLLYIAPSNAYWGAGIAFISKMTKDIRKVRLDLVGFAKSVNQNNKM